MIPRHGDEPTALYRWYDEDGVLLYVGVSFNPAARLTTHRYGPAPWRRIKRIELAWYDNRAAAFAAESEAIRTEDPLLNANGPGRWPGVPKKVEPFADWFCEMVRSGEWKPGDKLGSTQEWVEANPGLSASSVRKALRILLDRGVVTGRLGGNLFVADKH